MTAEARDGTVRRFEELAVAEDHAGWMARSRVFLTPIAAPAIMGLFGFMIATLMLGTLAASALTAAGLWAGSLGTLRAGGWLFVVAAMAAWLTAGAMVLEHSFGRTIIPIGTWPKKGNIPGAQATDPIAYPAGTPGARVGQ